MHRLIRAIVPFIFLPAVVAQQTAPRIVNTPVQSLLPPTHDKLSSSLIMAEMPLVAPLFIEDHSTTSVLALVNNGVNSAGATVSVHSLQGIETGRLHLVLKPHESRNLSIASLITSGTSSHYGSISVLQDSDLKGPAIAAQLLITDSSNTTAAYLDEELAMPDAEGSSILRGVTDEASGPTLLAVTNLSTTTQKVSVRCMGSDKSQTESSSTLKPFETSLTSACAGSFVTGLASFLSEHAESTSNGAVGIEVVGDGGPGQLAAFAMAPHRRGTDTVFSAVPFNDPSAVHSPDFVFAGVPIGPQPTLPDGLYIPRVSLSNFSSSPAQVTVSLNITARSRIGSSDNTSSIRRPQTIAKVTIPAHASREVLFTGIESQSGLLNSVYVTSDRQPGEVQGKLVSRSSGSLYQIELLGKDARDLNNGGVHPWTSEEDAESHLILYNHGKNQSKFNVIISNGAILWDKTYFLDASETLEISLNRLMADKTPDDNHQTLDPTLQHGVINWSTPNSGNATGRLMVTSRNAIMARNFSCGNYTVICSGYYANYNNFIGVGQALQLYQLYPSYCAAWGPGQCGGNQQSGGSASYYNYMNDSSIINFNDSSQQYAQRPMFLGMSPGSTTVYAQATENGCMTSGSGNPTVQIPTYIPIARTVYNSAASCGANQAGWDRSTYRQVEDQNGQPITTQYKNIHETFSNGPGPNPFNLTINTHDGITDITGQVPDEFQFCSPRCPAATDSSTFTQVVTEPDTGATYPLGSYTISYSCSNIKVNGALTP